MASDETDDATGESIDDGPFTQYAVLGQCLDLDAKKGTGVAKPIPSNAVLLNTNAPFSTFICGSQGSGKSHSLSCMLEGCLIPDERIGQLGKPLAGIVFHYDKHYEISEAAKLCSTGIDVRILVPATCEKERRKFYKKELGDAGAKGNVTVSPFYLQHKHLNVERLKKLMAFSDKEGPMPLYLAVSIDKIDL